MVTLSGVLVRKEVKRTYQGEVVPVYFVKTEGEKAERVLCTLSMFPSYDPVTGANVTLKGRKRFAASPTNPGEFDARAYDAVRKISYRLQNAGVLECTTSGSVYGEFLYTLRMRASAQLDAALPEKEASIMKAILLGDKNSMDAETKRLYRQSGIVHILAVSGLHISFIGLLLYRTMLRVVPVRRKKLRMCCALLCVLVMISYGNLCGMSASAFRAVLMFVMRVAADLLKRTYDMLTALAVAAVWLVIEQPLYLNDTGFWFSFLAVMAIALLVPTFHVYGAKLADTTPKHLRPLKARGLKIKEALKVSVAVTLMTMPVQMTDMYTVPVFATFLNLLVIPLMSVLFPFGLLTVAFGMIAPGMVGPGTAELGMAELGMAELGMAELGMAEPGIAGHVMAGGSLLVRCTAGVVGWILHFYEFLCEGASGLPLHTWYAGKPSVWQVIVYYLLLALFVFLQAAQGGIIRALLTGGTLFDILQRRVPTHIRFKHGIYAGNYTGDGGVCNFRGRRGLDSYTGDGGRCSFRGRRGLDSYTGDGGGCNFRGRRGLDSYTGDGGGCDSRTRRQREVSRFVLRHLWMWRLVWGLPVIAVLIMALRVPPSLQITMLDVGQGDGIVIRHRDFNILIDGGSTSKQSVGEYQILPYLKHEGIGTLDAVFISHEDKDHISGVLELLDDMERGGVQVRALFLPEVGRKLSDDNYKMVVERAASCGVPVMTLSAGERFSMGELQFTCLGPHASGSAVQGTNANARSMILHMSYGSFSALFTGDVEEEGLEELKAVLRGDGVTGGTLSLTACDGATDGTGEQAAGDMTSVSGMQAAGDMTSVSGMQAAGGVTSVSEMQAAGGVTSVSGMQAAGGVMGDIDLLKVPHHGSRYTTDEEFLALTRPEIALISCGRNNSYGHPHAETLRRLSDAGSTTLITARDGAITVRVSFGGRRAAVETFLK